MSPKEYLTILFHPPSVATKSNHVLSVGKSHHDNGTTTSREATNKKVQYTKDLLCLVIAGVVQTEDLHLQFLFPLTCSEMCALSVDLQLLLLFSGNGQPFLYEQCEVVRLGCPEARANV